MSILVVAFAYLKKWTGEGEKLSLLSLWMICLLPLLALEQIIIYLFDAEVFPLPVLVLIFKTSELLRNF